MCQICIKNGKYTGKNKIYLLARIYSIHFLKANKHYSLFLNSLKLRGANLPECITKIITYRKVLNNVYALGLTTS